jgi:hypothetical protein
MFQLLSIGAVVIVFVALLVLVFRSPGQLTRPSVLFLLFFCLQIQISSAINASSYVGSMGNPWIFFGVIHGFALSCLAIVLLTKRDRAENVFLRIGLTVDKLPIGKVVLALMTLLVLEYACFAIYLYHVPFEKTGLYAIMRKPEMLDSYRELSMKLMRGNLVRYSFALLEKVVAPIAGAVLALLVGRLWFGGRRIYAITSLLLLGVIIFPTLIYGARGPAAMVVLAMIFGFFLAFVRRVTVVNLGVSLVLVLVAPVLLMLSKNQNFSIQATAFQTLNVLDRAVGRGYIDNVWHIQRVERLGFYGVAAIEKLAYFFNLKPIDAFNEVAVENKDKGASFGLQFLEIDAPVIKGDGAEGGYSIADGIRCDMRAKADCIDVTNSASSSASFVVMNYAMFGWLGVIFSLVFVYAMDFLLFMYQSIDEVMLVPVIAALAVPVLGLSFSLLTTSLASKGLLLIPLICLVLGWLLRNIPLVRNADHHSYY